MRRFASLIRTLPNNPASFFLLVAIPATLLFIVLTPPFQAPDEPTHLYKIVQLSEGHVLASRIDDKHVGEQLPAAYLQTANRYYNLRVITTQKASVHQIFHDLRHPDRDKTPVFTPFENTAVYPPLSYVPQVVGVAIARAASAPVVLQLYIARLMSAAAFIVIVYAAIKRLPFGKWAAVALSCTPLSLFLAASCAGDAITAAIALFVIAAIARLARGTESLRPKDLAPLLAATLALGLCKSPYFLVAFLFFAIPMRRFSRPRNYWLGLVLIVGLPLLLALVWTAIVHGIVINIAQGSDNSLQLHQMVHHPLRTVETLARGLLFSSVNNSLPQQSIDLSVGMAAPFPQWLYITSYIFVTGAILFDPASAKLKDVARRMRLIALGIIAAGFAAITTLLYITFTAVGVHDVSGLQGRYFTPFWYLLIPAGGGLLVLQDKHRYKQFTACLCGFIVVGVAFGLLAIVARYYLPGYLLLSS